MLTGIEIKHLYKDYVQGEHAVEDMNLTIEKGEFVVFVGPSGCGKSTTLRMIAGLEDITSGEIHIEGELVNDKAPKDRDIAMVFQNYALYPQMSVKDNMSFGLKMKKEAKSKIESWVKDAADMIDMRDYLDRLPKELSGGQRQRVALGRAIVRQPKVFLMDEPLSNLDAKLRVQTRAEISQLSRNLSNTTIYVTHDQVEAMTMADRIVVMNQGKIQQVGSPRAIYLKPANQFVASFMGAPAMNFIQAQVSKDHIHVGSEDLPISPDLAQQISQMGYEGQEIVIGIRPENINVYKDQPEDQDALLLPLDLAEMLGSESLLHFSVFDQSIIAKKSTLDTFRVKEALYLVLDQDFLHFFNADDGSRIEVPGHGTYNSLLAEEVKADGTV